MSLNSALKSLLTGLVFAGIFLATPSCNHPDNEINATCFDEKQNQGEERVDCGGPNCDPCPPTCDDGILNQDEEAIDCGGPNCPDCGNCSDGIQSVNWDPATNSFVTEQGVDCGYPCPVPCAPSCDDGVQNGNEEGIDCGGSCSNPCPPPTCFDGVWNGTETGVDCGPDCPPCPAPTCSDGIMNQNETGIDCGGVCDNECPEATCTDGIQNQFEEGIDCGGPCPTLCPVEETCNDGVQNQDEEWIDCGGTDCPDIVCPTCEDMLVNGPEVDVDCIVGDYPNYTKADGTPCDQCPTCEDGMQNQNETYIDCGGPLCEPCEMYLNAENLGQGLSSGPFEGENFTVTQQGFDITFTATQTIGGQTRTLSIKIPLGMAEMDTEPLEDGFITAPSVRYTNFNGTVFESDGDNGDMTITYKSSGFNPDHIMGEITALITMEEQIPGEGTSQATNITFFLNY